MKPEDVLAKARKPSKDALRLHPFYRGKIQVLPKCPVRELSDFAIWYTPGVAAPCKAIHADPDLVYEYTNRGNAVAVVSDGTRVLGLGDIGPAASLPVMEGKALLFKYLGGVDATPICLGTRDSDELVRTVELLEPSFGGINLEDIAQPKCFTVLDALRERMTIPVWHDDQQGTATVVLAALNNALEITGKRLGEVRIAMIGMGAANVATYRLLKAAGADPAGIVGCDSSGILHRGRSDIESAREKSVDKWRVCRETNEENVTGGISEALEGADVCLAFSRSEPGLIQPEWIRRMASDAIVFACANPAPEIWPWDAQEAGARIVATGRGDFPNQVNNSLGFPAIFRGVLDVRARTISDGMAISAADALAAYARAREHGIREDNILPTMEEWEVFPRVAVATARKACEEGLACIEMDEAALLTEARRKIAEARDATHLLMHEGLIPAAPAPG